MKIVVGRTGKGNERFGPSNKVKATFVHHLKRYQFVRDHFAKGVVLDLASGEGYGTAILSQNANLTIGVDICKQVVADSKTRYADSGAHFSVGDARLLPFRSNIFDVVVGLEVIEHVVEQVQLLRECHRVLRGGGTLIVSTINTEGYWRNRPDMIGVTANPYHVKELALGELINLIIKHFEIVGLYGQDMLRVRLIREKFTYAILQALSWFFGNWIWEKRLSLFGKKVTVCKLLDYIVVRIFSPLQNRMAKNSYELVQFEPDDGFTAFPYVTVVSRRKSERSK